MVGRAGSSGWNGSTRRVRLLKRWRLMGQLDRFATFYPRRRPGWPARRTVPGTAGVQPRLLRGTYTLGLACQGSADRKSTRLNSSHVKISYAVFCLKKKNQQDSVGYD